VTAEDIKRNLVEFARKWSLYDGSERAEAQTFLNELFAAYGQDRYDIGSRSWSWLLSLGFNQRGYRVWARRM
jgi:hypothetical protein